MNMKIISTPIAGVMVVESIPFCDDRGVFSRLFCEQMLAPILGNRHIVQINYSRTTHEGAIRGLHLQRSPHAEMKMVRCLRGKVWDVAVDLRKDSPTFLQWYATELSLNSMKMLVIPEGCAHGFQVLEAESELLYLHTAAYSPDAETGVRFDDPLLNINWPLSVRDISKRDQLFSLLADKERK